MKPLLCYFFGLAPELLPQRTSIRRHLNKKILTALLLVTNEREARGEFPEFGNKFRYKFALDYQNHSESVTIKK